MSLFRIEVSALDGAEVSIPQIAYRNAQGVVLVLDEDDAPPEGFAAFTPEPSGPAAPTVVTMRQARLALLEAGKLDDIEAAVASLGQAAQIEWEYAQTVERSHALVQALGMTEAALDDLFTLAASK